MASSRIKMRVSELEVGKQYHYRKFDGMELVYEGRKDGKHQFTVVWSYPRTLMLSGQRIQWLMNDRIRKQLDDNLVQRNIEGRKRLGPVSDGHGNFVDPRIKATDQGI
jgi:hypothetical protein